MSFTEDEPRKIPKPFPYCEKSPLKSTVPDVSLILQESSTASKVIPHNSFSGTEFQSYNAWKWKNVNDREKENLRSRSFSNKKQDFYPISDKFSGSDIERRKNEILYGSAEDPRRPLPPRAVPIIPRCIGAPFSGTSFSNDIWNDNDVEDEILTSPGSYNRKINTKNIITDANKSVQCCSHDEPKDMKDLYQILADQNRQMLLLQKQIQQLLRSQESKENRIEHLLKSQETKENKIEQLLKMLNLKENHIDQLLKAHDEHEKQIERLIKAQDAREKQNNQSSKQVNTFDKQTATTGTMTEIVLCDKSTNVSFQHCYHDEKPQSIEESCKYESGDKSFTLHSLELPVVQEQIPTPQSSIHVDIPEYNASSDEDSDGSSSLSRDIRIHMLDSKPLGYTFYNNVLTQVNDIIHNNEDKEDEEALKMKIKSANVNKQSEEEYQGKYLGENFLKVTQSLGRENVEKNWALDRYEPRRDYQNSTKTSDKNLLSNGTNAAFQVKSNNEMGKENQSPSDISLKMNALALKYLKEEQISQYQMQFQSQHTTRQPDVTIYNVTNLSFGTMRYLERYSISSLEDDQSNFSSHQFLQQKLAMRNCNINK